MIVYVFTNSINISKHQSASKANTEKNELQYKAAMDRLEKSKRKKL